MLLEVDKLAGISPLREVLKSNEEPDLEAITDELNSFIHDSVFGLGKIGYEDAERFNLISAERYSPEQTGDLIEKIRQTRKVRKDSVYIAEIDEVPFGMAQQLAREAGGGAYTVTDARNAEIKIGILRGHELVGFVSADYWRDEISLEGLFLRKDYRGKGLAIQMLRCLMDKAGREGLKGLSMGNASIKGQGALRRLNRWYADQGKEMDFEMDWEVETLRNYAHIFFKREAVEA